jgi:hypothetical protein
MQMGVRTVTSCTEGDSFVLYDCGEGVMNFLMRCFVYRLCCVQPCEFTVS